MRVPGAGWRSCGVLFGIAVGIALLAVAASLPALDVPYLGGRVNDLARALSPAARERLETKLRDLETKTGAQLAVLTVPGLEGESLEGYSVKVAQTWKLGKKGVDDGVLFLVAKQDRKMRIEVGYGLESRLTDLVCRQILDERVRPRFRQNDFDGGIEAGVDAIAAVIAGRALPAPPPAARGSIPLEGIWAILFVGGIFTIVVGMFSFIALVSSGFMAWFLYVFLTLFYALVPTGLVSPYVGLATGAAWIIGFPILRHWLNPGAKDFRRRHPRIAGFVGSGGHSGSGGGWGGGGFSGGGGGFGGGGASGGW